jgi:hypothetical protein
MRRKHTDRAKLKERESQLQKAELSLNESIEKAIESIDSDNLESIIQSIAIAHNVHPEVVTERLLIFLQ